MAAEMLMKSIKDDELVSEAEVTFLVTSAERRDLTNALALVNKYRKRALARLKVDIAENEIVAVNYRIDGDDFVVNVVQGVVGGGDDDSDDDDLDDADIE
jgi:hypothetical protein